MPVRTARPHQFRPNPPLRVRFGRADSVCTLVLVDPLIWEGEAPDDLRRPMLVCAFAGWNDAASAATTALEAVAVTPDSEVLARIDPEEFFAFQDNRPTVRLTEGQTRHIEWPTNTLISAEAPGAERDLLLISGTEPSLRWRTFTEAILDAIDRF